MLKFFFELDYILMYTKQNIVSMCIIHIADHIFLQLSLNPIPTI